jgi:serine/threonine-protein kinase
LVHRDVKPGNLFLVDEDDPDDIQIRVLDFGIVQLTQSDVVIATGTALTRRGSQPGTLRYMSPEQRRGAPTLTPASDVYSLGVVGFELLTGAEPLSEWDREKVSQGYSVPIPSICTIRPDLSPVVDDLIQRSLQLDPKSRFQSAAEFEVALRSAIRTVTAAGPALRGDGHQPHGSGGSAGVLLRDKTGASNPPPWASTPFGNDDITTDIGISPDQNQDSSTGEPYAHVAPHLDQPEVSSRALAGTDNLPSGGAVSSVGRLVHKMGYVDRARMLGNSAAQLLLARRIGSRLPLVLGMAAVLGITGVGLAWVSSRQIPVSAGAPSVTLPHSSSSGNTDAAPESDDVLTGVESDAQSVSREPRVRQQRPVVNGTPPPRITGRARSQPANPARVIPPSSGRAETPSTSVRARAPQPSPPPVTVQRPIVAQAPPRQRPIPEKSVPQAVAPSTRTPTALPKTSTGQVAAVTRPPAPNPPAASTPPPPVSVAETPPAPIPPAEPTNGDLSRARKYLNNANSLSGVNLYHAAGLRYDSATLHLSEVTSRFPRSEKVQKLEAEIKIAKTQNQKACLSARKVVNSSIQCP